MSLIHAVDIEKSFGTGELTTHVLKGITMDVAAGEFLAIMGKSGAGKSTLLYQLSLLDRPTAGSLTITDMDVLALSEQAQTTFRLNTLGFVFQDYALVPDLTAEENVMLPLMMRGTPTTEARQIARTAIDEVGLTNKYTNLPGQLSGGEQQRVSVARATAGRPTILYADEPTANLDTASGAAVVDLITCLNKEHGQTVVMVTHEREYAANCDRILHLEDGLIVHEE